MDRPDIPRYIRQILVQEIQRWQKLRIITPAQCETLTRLYNYDFEPAPVPIPKPSLQPVPAAPPPQPAVIAQPVPAAPPPPPVPPAPPKPRPTLAQTLLSETSIKIALYLGAFFVIAAALILAALVESLRLPILGVVAVLFAGGATVLKRRLPQPSFILFLVFSALLPITGGVLADGLKLSGLPLERYWVFLLLGMALLWAFSTWLYKSRFFSLTALLALDAAALMGASLVNPHDLIWTPCLLALASLIALGAAFALKRWRGKRMILPLFILSQIQEALALLVLIGITLAGQEYGEARTAALAFALVSVYYVLSDLHYSSSVYRWLAALVFMPVGWLVARYLSWDMGFWHIFSSGYDPSIYYVTAAIAVTGWGVLYTLFGALFARAKEYLGTYALPLSFTAIPLLLVGSWLGIRENTWLGSALSLGAALVLAAAHVLYRRTWVWVISLGFALAAYLSLAYSVDGLVIYHSSSWLAGATLLLLLPEMVAPNKLSNAWRWPLRGWAILAGAATLTAEVGLHYVYLASDLESVVALLTLGTAGLLYLIYGIRIRRSWLGILFSIHATLAWVFWLDRYRVHSWLAILTCLAVVFFATGVILKWLKLRDWSPVFRWSGLALGGLLSLAAFAYVGFYRSFYVAAIAALFLVETFRAAPWLEVAPAAIASLAFVMGIYDARVDPPAYYSAGIAVIFFILDLLYLHMKRPDDGWVTRALGALAALTTLILIFVPAFAAKAGMIACAGLTGLLLIQALVYRRQAWLGVFISLYLTISSVLWLNTYAIRGWLPTLTCLAVFLYGCGMIFKWWKQKGWSSVFRGSGLVLAGICSIAAFFYQGSAPWFYVLVGAFLFIYETYQTPWLESLSAFVTSLGYVLVLSLSSVEELAYYPAGIAAIFLGTDLLFSRRHRSGWRWVTRGFGGFMTLLVLVAVVLPTFEPAAGAIACAALTAIFLVQALLYRRVILGYAVTLFFTLTVLFTDLHYVPDHWLWSMIGTAILFYVASILLDHLKQVRVILLYSGLALASLTAISAPYEGSGLVACIPAALAATLWAVEALRRRNVWLAFPANALYLLAYFMLLAGLGAHTQFYSVGAAVLGLLMHYLLLRAGSKTGAFIMGMASQLVLIGTSYIQFIDTEDIWMFAVMFFQSLAVLAYGVVIRSRSLVIAPIVLVVIGVITIVFGALRELSAAILIGVTGIGLIVLGIAALLMRERISNLRDLLRDWHA